MVFNYFLVKKVTLIFPSAEALWEFFALSELREFRLESANCSVTGRFTDEEIAMAKEKMKANLAKKTKFRSERSGIGKVCKFARATLAL